MRLTLLTLIAVLFLGASCQQTPPTVTPAPVPPAVPAPQPQPSATQPQPSTESSAAPAAMANDNLDQALQELEALE